MAGTPDDRGREQRHRTVHADRAHLAGTIAARAAAFDIAYRVTDSVDVNAIRARLAPAVDRVRHESAPLVVEFRTHRLGPHSKGDDARPAGAIAAARSHDWLPRYRDADPNRFDALDRQARDRVAAAVRAIQDRPLATWDRS